MTKQSAITEASETKAFVELVHLLRKKCPWDRKQTHQSLVSYLIEEAYEVVEAIDKGDIEMLCEELGDLFLQIVLHSEIASEKKRFDFDTVVSGIREKMIRRHPHVFGKKRWVNQKEHLATWSKLKAKENPGKLLLDGIPTSLPALLLAERYGKILGSVGLDWRTHEQVLTKVHEEFDELKVELLKTKKNKHHVAMELGDVLFTIAQLARHLGINAEQALKASASKFRNRVDRMEKLLKKKDQHISDKSFEELGETWHAIKSMQ